MMNAEKTYDHAPLYNLSVVLRETNLKADLVRAWEQRYGLPKPQRSTGGHRLYSEYDIETLKWLHNRQVEGLSISRAVELWHQLLRDGQDPFGTVKEKYSIEPVKTPGSGTSLKSLRDEWVDACMRFDGFGAEAVLSQSFSFYPVELVCTGLLQEGLRIMGERWYDRSATVHQEHFASAFANRKLDTLLSSAPLPTRNKNLMVGCPAGEWHTFPALLQSVLLTRRGYRVVYLGANLPPEQLAETADVIKPDLVILSAQRLTTAATLREASIQLQNYPVAFGGLIFNQNPELERAINGYFLGPDLLDALQSIETLFASPREKQPASHVNPEYLVTLEAFSETRGMIEMRLNEYLKKENITIGSLREANDHFGSGLSAALSLGGLGLLHGDLAWVNRMLKNRPDVQSSLKDYLKAYRQAVDSVMGKDGALITDWLDGYIQSSNDMRMN
jgi:DNA-binding transcriptional MerR regulator